MKIDKGAGKLHLNASMSTDFLTSKNFQVSTCLLKHLDEFLCSSLLTDFVSQLKHPQDNTQYPENTCLELQGRCTTALQYKLAPNPIKIILYRDKWYMLVIIYLSKICHIYEFQ